MKFFVIGLGSIGLRHARNLLALGHEVCGYDKDPNKFIQAQDELGIPISSKEDGADAYVVCTPPDQRSHDYMDAYMLGKHLFVEKPIAHKIDWSLEQAIKEMKSKNLVFMVGNMLRFHPNVILAKQHIHHPMTATFRVKQKNTKYTEDVILNWGAHEIDLALYLLGPGECAEASGTRDNAKIVIRHTSGIQSSIYMDYLTEPEVRNFTVETLDLLEHNIDLTLHDWKDIYMAEMKEFIYRICLNHGVGAYGAPPLAGATGEDGLATLRIINDAQRMAGI
jgi:predicted dehydrogenase